MEIVFWCGKYHLFASSNLTILVWHVRILLGEISLILSSFDYLIMRTCFIFIVPLYIKIILIKKLVHIHKRIPTVGTAHLPSDIRREIETQRHEY